MPFSLNSANLAYKGSKAHRSPDTRNMGNTSVVLLIAAGLCALLFTLAAGFFVYTNTRSLVAAKDWVEHTQEVLTSLQTASLLTDRIEFSTRLYALSPDQAPLNTARLSAIGLETAALHIRSLVVDNSAQTHNIENLSACAASLSSTMRGFTPGTQLPINAVLRCREATSLMAEQERALLKWRSQKSQHSLVVSLLTECAFIGFSLFTLIVLFSFLLRDAVLRCRSVRQAALTNESLEASVHALEERIHESRLLTACRDELQLCTTVQQVYHATADCLEHLLPHSSGALSIINNSRHMLEVVSSWGVSGPEASMANTAVLPSLSSFAPPPALPLAVTESFASDSCCSLRLGQLRWRRAEMSEIDCTHFTGAPPTRYLCIPMVAQGETCGVLSIECVAEAAYLTVQKRMDVLRHLLQLTGMAAASLNLRIRLENQSIRDALTGLFNRHFMQIVLERELSRAAREKTSLAVFMLDVDHFKRFNDTHGHGAGDAMLQAIAEAFTFSVRVEDTVCRYGGEEFAIILPGMTPENAVGRAERIRAAVTRLRIPIEAATHAEASVSIGIAFYPTDATTSELLLRKADQALYHAKHNGRNQVALSEVLTGV